MPNSLLTRLNEALSRLETVIPHYVDDSDPGPDEDDDPEGDCWTFHQCIPGGSQYGYCLERAGHSGPHRCTKCGDEFWK